ncbi:MAG: DUF3108 domain-containing protein [Magnetococcus sp. MYC-9]
MACALPSACGAEEGGPLGAATGEWLHFQVRWLGIPSGEATLQLEVGERGNYSVQASVASIGAARVLRAIDDRLTAEGQRQRADFVPRHSAKEQLRSDHSKWIGYLFDREMRQVVRRVRARQGEEERPEERLPIPLASDRVRDPLSAFYALRAQSELLPGHSLERLIVDGEKVYCLSITPGSRQRMQTALGDFTVIPLQVAVDNSELFRQRGPILIWLTDDARRMPIRVEAQLAFGAVVAELAAFEAGNGG